MYTLDHSLFMALNFDGGAALDRTMLIVSGTTMWLPLYALIIWMVWRRAGWRNTLLFVILMVAALGLSDVVSGIFKHNGLLGDLLPGLEPRPRPMFTPELEEFLITPDSLAALRRSATSGIDWAVHVPREALGGMFGTVSAHAATIAALATLSALVIRRRWFSWLMGLCTLLICYSRIYLGKHYPMDLVWGTLLGVALGLAALAIYHKLCK